MTAAAAFESRRLAPAGRPSREVVLVVNANASGVRRDPGVASRAAFALRAAGATVELVVTRSVSELALVAADPRRRLVLLGGDGTVHAFANLPLARAAAALLPVGGANNVARSLGIPATLEAAAELAVRGRARPLDTIEARAGDRRVVAVEGVSVGFHALARARYRAVNSTSMRAAVGAGLSAVHRFRAVSVALEVDGRAEIASLGQLFVANLPLYGPRLQVAPGADPADGLVDVVTVATRGRVATVSALVSLRRGHEPGAVARRRASRVRIVAAGGSPVIADTVDLGPGPVELTPRPASLRIVVPGGGYFVP